MKLLSILLTAFTLTGCATGCREACIFGFGPGNSAFDSWADFNDRNDVCQYKGKPAGYKLPPGCGSTKYVTITSNGQTRTYGIQR